MNSKRGCVYLVGAGPGHPGLMTVLGRDLLRKADVILYDRLVAKELLSEARREAEIIYVGKSPGEVTLAQDRINSLLVERAMAGQTAVRLKGGDPFLFGRGFEEFSACRAAGVDCQVVPGVTSALAGPAVMGIPVTDRSCVRSVAIVSASGAEEAPAPPLNFSALARMDTLVILMGAENLSEITSSLLAEGKDPLTPSACVTWATTDRQRSVRGELKTIAESARQAGLTAPMITVIGKVAGL